MPKVAVLTPPLVVKLGAGAPCGTDDAVQARAGGAVHALPNWSMNVGIASCTLVPET